MKPDSKTVKRALTRDEIASLLTECASRASTTNGRVRHAYSQLGDLIVIACATGLRIGELRLIETRNVDPDGRFFRVRIEKKKRETVAKIIVAERARPALLRRLAEARRQKSFTLIFTYNIQPYTSAGLSALFGKLTAAVLDERLGTHCLRRTFATNFEILLRNNKMSIDHLRLAMNHARLDTTLTYIRSAEQERARELLKKADWF